jgi:hypothetical protein
LRHQNKKNSKDMAKRSSVIGYWLLFTGYWLFSATAMAQGVTDVHSHIITTEFLSALEGEGRLLDEGFTLPKYDAAAHLRWMDEAGVETSVLTLAAPQPSDAKIVRSTNEAAARLKQAHLLYVLCRT